MDSSISYINDRGEYKLAIVPEEVADDYIRFDEYSELYTYEHPIQNTVNVLHSIADRPCLCETNDRKHWMWMGKLHRLTGPAFSCNGNQEFYAFGVMLSPEEMAEGKSHFLKIEAFALANGIDLHGSAVTIAGVTPSRYFLPYADSEQLLRDARENKITVCDRTNGYLHRHGIADLAQEVDSVEERGPGLLMAAVLAATAAFAASKAKGHLESRKKSLAANSVEVARSEIEV